MGKRTRSPCQGQSGSSLLSDGTGQSYIRQGITTEIIGEGSTPGLWTADQFDEETARRLGFEVAWHTFDGYLRTQEARGTSINLGSFASINQIRGQVIGVEDRPATDDELLEISVKGGAKLQTTVAEAEN